MLRRSKLGRRFGSTLAVALLVFGGSCRDATTAPPEPSNASPPADHLLGLPGFWGSPRLLSCPATEAQSTSAQIGAEGGTLSLGGTSVTLPLGALLEATTVELTIPAGQYMEVDLSVNGGQHIDFPQPVVVTIDYSRCNRSDIDHQVLHVYHIDPDTHELLEDMGGVDDKLSRHITFTTGHLSGYAVAN